MNTDLCETIRRLSRPLEPRATGLQPVLRKLPGIRAVVFDVYGTMFISASGDVGTAMDTSPADAFTAALLAAGIECATDGELGVSQLVATISKHHERSRHDGIPHPEVDIVAVWRDTLVDSQARQFDIERLAVEYEARANPVWPMPHLESCLTELRCAGQRLGIVSNAQFYTPLLFTALLAADAESLGFDKDLQFFSYRTGRAKPDRYLYDLACQSLANMGIKPAEVVFVGNDMLNDITPAAQAGFHTALFAGDARSLRLRETDARVDGVTPDLVLTDLSQLVDCVS